MVGNPVRLINPLPDTPSDAGDAGAEWAGKALVLGAALIFANVCFAVLRFVTERASGQPTGWWINAYGAVASIRIVLWFAAAPLPRLVVSINVGLGLVWILLLAPAPSGYACSPWWLVILPLAGSAVLDWRQGIVWAVVAAAGMVFALVGVPALGGPSVSREPLAGRVVLVVLVAAFALGVRRISDLRAAAQLEARRVLGATNAHLAEVSRAKSVFPATLSHEMRTPLHGVLGMTALVLDASLSPVARDYVQTAHESGAALLAIINDILDCSKIAGGGLAIENVAFDLHAVLIEALRPLFSEAVGKGLTVTCTVAPGMRRTRVGDPTRVRQIVANMVGNAVKFTRAGSVARLLCEADDSGRVRIAVADTGIGIPGDRLGPIFEPHPLTCSPRPGLRRPSPPPPPSSRSCRRSGWEHSLPGASRGSPSAWWGRSARRTWRGSLPCRRCRASRELLRSVRRHPADRRRRWTPTLTAAWTSSSPACRRR